MREPYNIQDDLAWLDYFLEQACILTADIGMSIPPELIKGDECTSLDGGMPSSNIRMFDRLVARKIGSRRRD